MLRAEPTWGCMPRDWWQKATLCAHKPCAGCGDAAGQPPAMGTAEQCCATSPPTATAAAITQPVRPLQCLWGTERQKGRAAAGAQRKAGQPDGTAAKERRFLSATMLPSLLQAQGGHCPAQPVLPAQLRGSTHSPTAGQPHLLTPFTPGDGLHGALRPLKAHGPGCVAWHCVPPACPTHCTHCPPPAPHAGSLLPDPRRCWGKAAPPGTAQQSPPRCHR